MKHFKVGLNISLTICDSLLILIFKDDKNGNSSHQYFQEQLILPSHKDYKPWSLLRNIPSHERTAA